MLLLIKTENHTWAGRTHNWGGCTSPL